MTTLGYHAASSFRFIALVAFLPILFAVVLHPVVRLLARSDVERWTRNTFMLACIAALWTATLSRDPLWVLVPPALTIAAACLLRHFRARFSRADVVLLPAALALFIGLVDITRFGVDRCVILSAAIVFALRLCVVDSLCFALTPLSFVPATHFFSYDQRHLGWPALAIVVVTPIVLRLTVRDWPRFRRAIQAALAWIILPLSCYAYLSATSLFAAEGKPRVSAFEAAQHVVPASEMMRGERPYRDIIPAHGLVQDALLDYLLMRQGASTIGQLTKARGTVSALNAIAQYALGVAITGTAAGGVLAFFVAATLGLGGGTFRVLPALLTLAITIAAVRTRRSRLVAFAAAGVVASIITSLDFGTYAAVALLMAIVRFPGDRLRALRDAAIGAGTASLIVAIALASAGILGAFIRVTLTEIPGLAPVYALTVFQPPKTLEATHFIPDVLVTIFDRTTYLYLIWIAALLFLAVALSQRTEMNTRGRARIESFVVLSSFVVICAVSYAERHDLYFQFAVPALLVGTVIAVARARFRALRFAAPIIAIAILIIQQPTIHLGIVAWLRHQRGPTEVDLHEVASVPRARGAFFRGRDATIIEVANRYQAAHLAPGETFFDFTNRGLLYYLFDRDCPVRQIEVAFYEQEARQREVIAAIAGNPRIRAAMIPPPNDDTGVDLVPNSVRAPLVWQYLQEHFTPDFEEGPVVFWRRRPPTLPAGGGQRAAGGVGRDSGSFSAGRLTCLASISHLRRPARTSSRRLPHRRTRTRA
jgi:hypothetical protein